jgi:predicted NodU family carbamoyl transferase
MRSFEKRFTATLTCAIVGLSQGFRDPTGVPMVLNTSFNENEPVVCEPQDARLLFANENGFALSS